MKDFFKMMFASALGIFIALGLLIILSIFALIGITSTIDNKEAYTPKENTVLELTLNGELKDNVQVNPIDQLLNSDSKELSLKDILLAIKKAKATPQIKGIYLNAKYLSAGTASIDEIRRALIDFKKTGKFVVAYADNYLQGSYYLCSVADKIFLNPQGIVGLSGMSRQTMFYSDISKKLGVEWEIFKVGTYKGAVEPYFRKNLSDENREQITSYLNGIWHNIEMGIAESRKISVEQVDDFVETGSFLSPGEKAITAGLIDQLKFRYQVENYIKDLAGQSKDKLKTVGVSKIKTIDLKEKQYDQKIAILYAEGEIKQDIGVSPMGLPKEGITEDLVEDLQKLQKDSTIKAVVLRVNSPGGSAYTSEQIWKQIVELKKVKPIVVSMGNVAASGGYYISCFANKIVAEHNTITGSIGIFGLFPNFSEAAKNVGLTTDVVKTNQFSDFGNAFRPMRKDEKALMQNRIEKGYQIFLTRCAEGRSKTKEEINAIGQGRVWTGEQALKNGLVDDLGGINKAIEIAAELADLTDYNVISVDNEKDFFEELLKGKLDNIKVSLVKNILGNELYNEIESIQNCKNKTTMIQARLPYDVNPL